MKKLNIWLLLWECFCDFFSFFSLNEGKQTPLGSLLLVLLLARYRQRLNLNKFRLLTLFEESDYAVVNRWIDYAIECNVKELNLDMPRRKGPKFYELPGRVLVANSITELSLCECKLKSFYSDINLSSLKKLVFSFVVGESQHVQTLIDSCRDIEEMTIECCPELKSIRVSGLPKLKAIALLKNSGVESVEIEASNLESLVFKHSRLPCQLNLGPCKNLKKLVLRSCCITDEWLHDVLSKHQLIECLDLVDCFILKRIKISSHCMKSLTFISCYKLVEVDIVTPNLHRLEYEGYVISFSLNSSSLSEVILYFSEEISSDAEMIEFLSKLSQPKLLTWTLDDDEVVYFIIFFLFVSYSMVLCTSIIAYIIEISHTFLFIL
jgi:hypothetical protein